MRRFLVVLSLIIFTTNSAFAACGTGYEQTTITIPSTQASSTTPSEYDYGGGNNDFTTWSMTWNGTGTLTGTVACSTTGGNQYCQTTQAYLSSTTGGGNCWCKPTQWTTSSGETVELSSYYYLAADSSSTNGASGCTSMCAMYCAMFGSSGTSYMGYAQSCFGSTVTGCVASSGSGSGSGTECEAGTYQQTTTTTVTFPTTEGSTSTYNGSARTWSVTWNNVGTASGESACTTVSVASMAAYVTNSNTGCYSQ